MRGLRRFVGIGLAVAVGGGLFYWAFRDIHPVELFRSLKGLRPAWVPFLVLAVLADLWVRACRWRILLSPIRKTNAWLLFQLECIGLAINNLLFLRLGEIARGVVAGRELKISTLSALATIVVERVFDMTALLVVFSAAAWAMPGIVDPRLRNGAAAAAAAAVVLIAATTVLGERLQAWLKRMKRFEKPRQFARDLILGTRALRDWRNACGIAVWSLTLWVCDSAAYWTASYAMGLRPPLSPGEGVLVLTSAAAGCALPAVPGAFGNFEAAIRLLMEHLGYAKTAALSYAAFAHVMFYIVMTTLGIVFLYRLGHTFSGLRKALSRSGGEG